MELTSIVSNTVDVGSSPTVAANSSFKHSDVAQVVRVWKIAPSVIALFNHWLRSSAGRCTWLLIKESWVRVPPGSLEFWVLSFEFWVLSSEFWVLSFEFWVLSNYKLWTKTSWFISSMEQSTALLPPGMGVWVSHESQHTMEVWQNGV